MKFRLALFAMLLLTLTQIGAAQTPKHDPLSEKEVDEMRETADFPNKRLETLIKFARVRMASIDELRANAAKAKDRPRQIHDLLQDFTALLDEVDDNIDMYSEHKADMRGGLKLLIEADSEWSLKLRNLKTQSPPEELDEYSFALNSANDAVSDGADSAREELAKQNALAAEKKLNKVYSERKD